MLLSDICTKLALVAVVGMKYRAIGCEEEQINIPLSFQRFTFASGGQLG